MTTRRLTKAWTGARKDIDVLLAGTVAPSAHKVMPHPCALAVSAPGNARC
jgi:hypothetical protein